MLCWIAIAAIAVISAAPSGGKRWLGFRCGLDLSFCYWTSLTFAEPATTPAPSSAPAVSVIKVKRGDLEQKIVTTGTFEPVDPFEVGSGPSRTWVNC